MNDQLKVRDIPLLKNGVMLEARLLKAPIKAVHPGVGVNVETIRSEQVNPRCNHPPGGKCLNCMTVDKKTDEKTEPPKPAVFGSINPLTGSKCNHGPGGKCFNCVQAPTGKDQVKPSCNHGPTTKCIHCFDSQFISDVAHVSFDHYLS